MRQDHRPYYLKRFSIWLRQLFAKHFKFPEFEIVGKGALFFHPPSVKVFGKGIALGNHVHLISSRDKPIRFTTMPHRHNGARIVINDFCLIAPNVRIAAEREVIIGKSCMIAANCYISDCDWHGIYNRTRPFRCTEPVKLENNVWLGDGVIVTKGVTIGENSVIGAGSVVTSDIPANVVAAGNPARIIKEINPKRRMLTRADLFAHGYKQAANLDAWDRDVMAGNTFLGWLRSIVWPRRGD